MRRLFFYLASLLFVFFTLIFSFNPIRDYLYQIGYLKERVSISGTGSMYPTFPKSEENDGKIQAEVVVANPLMRHYPGGFNVFGKKIFSYNLQYGDIIEFANEQTKKISQEKYGQEAGFVKRVIGLPTDLIELRDGFVYRNGEIVNEPYIAQSRSSYGGEFIQDCQVVKVLDNHVFVLGDNRKASLDSRYKLGFIKLADIDKVIPFADQDEYRHLWRDTTNDLSLSNTSTLDTKLLLSMINSKRREKKLKALNFNSLLSKSSQRRGNVMLTTNDFSTEASKSGITLIKSINEVDYKNIIFAEFFTRGYYEAEELLENFLEFPETAGLIYSSDYQDIGVSVTIGEIEDCPTQIVVVHLGGFIPPNYTSDELESWKKLKENLEEVIPSWEGLKSNADIDLAKLDQIIYLLKTRLDNVVRIYNRMKQNQWLTEEEKNLVISDKQLGEQVDKLIKSLKSL